MGKLMTYLGFIILGGILAIPVAWALHVVLRLRGKAIAE
jgi:hypothetical protein